MSQPDNRFEPELLDAFAVPEPSPDLGDRLFATLAQRRRRVRRDRGKRWAVALASMGVFAAAAVLLVSALGRTHSRSGALTAEQRSTIEIGMRGLAVAEPGTRLSWRVAESGNVRIEQAAGNVFYRVERGGKFVVATPYGDVSVRGTCFRVEIEEEVRNMGLSRKSIVAGAAGAALSAVVVVAVYEGKVLLANEHGQVELAAGDQGKLSPGHAPRLAEEATAVASEQTATEPPATATREELLERDRAQRARITKLEAEIERFEKADAERGDRDDRRSSKPPFELSQEELVELARTCSIPFDMVPTAGSSIMEEILEEGLGKADFSKDERAAVERVITQFQPGYTTALQALYRELTGENGEALDTTTLMFEILQKSPRSDILVAKQNVARERAGLQPPPADPNAGSVIERFFRLAVRAGDDFHAALADVIPPDRAREFRRHWGEVNSGPGCPED